MKEKRNPHPFDTSTVVSKRRSKNYFFLIGPVVIVISIIFPFPLNANQPDSLNSYGIVRGYGSTPSSNVPDGISWPFFRGQNSRGIAGGNGYPVEWNGETGMNIEWKTEIPGNGKSSPVIWNDKIFITGAEGKDCEVYCINKKDGRILWVGSASNITGEPDIIPKSDPEAGLAVPTPATDGKGVYAIFGNGNLICYDMDGKQKWAKNIGVPENTYGYSSSLLIYNNTLFVQFESQAKATLIGFDTGTGEKKWETARKGMPVWSSPVLAFFGDKPQVIVNGNPGVSSFDAVTGEGLWTVDCLTGDVAPSAAANSTMVFSVTDYAVLSGIKAGSTPSIIWQDNSYTPDASSPVADDKFLFLTTGTGDIACYNPEKGDTLWTSYIPGQFYASPVIADGMVYMLDRSGIMHIIKENNKYELVAESPLGENSDCTPAFSEKKIYIRGKKHLYCITNNNGDKRK